MCYLNMLVSKVLCHVFVAALKFRRKHFTESSCLAKSGGTKAGLGKGVNPRNSENWALGGMAPESMEKSLLWRGNATVGIARIEPIFEAESRRKPAKLGPGRDRDLARSLRSTEDRRLKRGRPKPRRRSLNRGESGLPARDALD